MKELAKKMCDCCKDVVAIKYFIRYNTVKNYVTIRGDDVTTYVNECDCTTPYELHYCRECWEAFWGRYCKDGVGV